MAVTGLPSGAVTFLFTDLESSTRLWEEHPDAMRDALARHDAILGRCIEDHHGFIVKSTGDGAYAVFAAVPDAANAAAAVIRTLHDEPWGATGPLRARMGLHSGNAEERDGDYFGPVLNRASRLMAAAHGGQVVLSHVSAEFVREVLADGLTLLDLGEHRLRGIERPERVYELVISGVPSDFPPLQSLDALPGALSLPGPSFARGVEALAGRDVELDRLAAAWSRAKNGVRQIALIAGEPGIGKTRLSIELARRVQAEGGVVLYGRCDEEMIVPFQPFVEALRPCVAVYSPSTLHQRLHGLEQDLVRVFPELHGRVAERPVGADAEAERYRFFEAITTLVTGMTAVQPALVILDDLHWADKPTLLLLRHLLRAAPHAALCIVGCYRDVELHSDDQLADFLADLRRESVVTRITLGGLSEEESGRLLCGVAGREVSVPLITALHHETDGNPFFLEELLRHMIETDAVPVDAGSRSPVDLSALGIPDGVREVVARRLRRLPDPVGELLHLAAVVGRDFDAELLGRAWEQRTAPVLESLDLATDAGLLRRDPDRIGWYTFAHVLIRQSLNSSLGTAQRARLHARVGAAIEAGGGAPRAAELARHFTYALPVVGAEKAIEFTALAGREAMADLAFEDAAAYLQNALDLLERHAPADEADRVELLTDLAAALVYVDERTGVEIARRAVNAARANGSTSQFGRAVAVFVEPTHSVDAYPTEVTSLLDEARTRLGDGDGALRARLLAFEAFKYATYQLRGRDPRALAEQAVGIARALDDPVALSDALWSLAVSLEGSGAVAERMALGDELVELVTRAGARASAFGLRVLAGVDLERGDAARVTATIDKLARTCADLRWLPGEVYATQWRGTQALIEGRFADVSALGDELRRHVRAYRGAAGMNLVQAFFLARDRGLLGSLGSLDEAADGHVHSLLTGAMLALAQLDSGDDAGAVRSLERAADEEFQRNEPGNPSGAALGMFAEVAATGGTRAHARVLSEMLAPFSGRLLMVVLGPSIGAADRYLGMLDTVLERWERAESHFERAVELEEGVRGWSLLPRTHYWRARFLAARGQPGDASAAAKLLFDVAADADRLDMRRLVAQAEELLAR